MMDAIAGIATSMSAAQFATEYSMGVTKKVMDTQEAMAQNILEMLPDVSQMAPPKGQFIDVYA